MTNLSTLAGGALWAVVAVLLAVATLEPISSAHAAAPGGCASIGPVGNVQRA